METLSYVQKVQILCGFMSAVCGEKYLKQRGKRFVGGMAKLNLNKFTAFIAKISQPKPAKEY